MAPKYTCGLLIISSAKQNIARLTALTTKAITLVIFEPPLSTTTRLSRPEKMIAMPPATNQSVSRVSRKGKAYRRCTMPNTTIKMEIVPIKLRTAYLFIFKKIYIRHHPRGEEFHNMKGSKSRHFIIETFIKQLKVLPTSDFFIDILWNPGNTAKARGWGEGEACQH